MTDRPFYHEGMRALQDRFDGRRVADALEQHRKHNAFWDSEIALIQSTPFFFIASSYNDYVDCAIKSGDPGFVHITGPATIEYPEYDGNSMYRTLGNIAKNSSVGLLFVRFDGESLRLRANGKATIHDDSDSIAAHHGAKLVVRIECELYPNCPRYLPDFDSNQASPYIPREGEPPPPPPVWKQRESIRDLLPDNDPHKDQVQSRKQDD